MGVERREMKKRKRKEILLGAPSQKAALIRRETGGRCEGKGGRGGGACDSRRTMA